jgi:hypothetical protein
LSVYHKIPEKTRDIAAGITKNVFPSLKNSRFCNAVKKSEHLVRLRIL